MTKLVDEGKFYYMTDEEPCVIDGVECMSVYLYPEGDENGKLKYYRAVDEKLDLKINPRQRYRLSENIMIFVDLDRTDGGLPFKILLVYHDPYEVKYTDFKKKERCAMRFCAKRYGLHEDEMKEWIKTRNIQIVSCRDGYDYAWLMDDNCVSVLARVGEPVIYDGRRQDLECFLEHWLE